MKLIDKLLSYEKIDGDGRCAIYLHRWTLAKTRWFTAYLHHFVGSDWARDPHDHPKRFVSIGLWGEYDEEDHSNLQRPIVRRFKAPWLRSWPASYRHRISMTPRGSAWTICIVGEPVREWGFWYKSQRWIKWDDYLESAGNERKDC